MGVAICVHVLEATTDMERQSSNGEANGLLTIETAPGYVTERAEVIGVFPPGASLTATEINGGNLNYAFHVTDGERSVFVKQAPDFIKCFGPAAQLHKERMELEVRVFRYWAEQLGPELTARFLPKIYLFDESVEVFVMDFLGDHKVLDSVLESDGEISDEVWNGIGTFMALTHARTHSTRMPSEQVETLHAEYSNAVLRSIQLDYVFTKCYVESANPAGESNSLGTQLGADGSFMEEIESLKAAYRGEQLDNRAVCHGDFHPGSVMINNTLGDAKIIDPEFCVYGPPGLDLGSLLSGVILLVISKQFATQPDAASISRLVDVIDRIWNTYAAAMEQESMASDVVKRISEDAVGFACAEVARTSLGFAGVRGLKVDDAATKLVAQEATLGLVQRCIMGRRIEGAASMEILTNELRSLGKSV